MLENFISKGILQFFNFTPTSDQETLIDELSKFVSSGNRDKFFLIKGYAGTGKTTVISAFINTLKEYKLKTILLAPTGRAAKVLSNYSQEKALTIHKKIYRQKSSKDAFGNFNLNKNLHTNTLFIVDEASMISNTGSGNSIFGSGRLLDDLVEYVYSSSSCSLILLGDTAQLPPVGTDISPALDKHFLEGYGFDVTEIQLKEVVRQQKNSGILENATLLRNLIDTENIRFPQMITKKKKDFLRIGGEDLIEEISTSYSIYGMDETAIICYSNKRANIYNQGIRNSILYYEEEISIGDYIMIVKNNYYWTESLKEIDFIANGDIAKITRIKSISEAYGFRYADITIELPDYDNIELDVKIFLDTLNINAPALENKKMSALYYLLDEEYTGLSKKERYKKIRNNKFFNALQVKFAYAVTCHKAQGGQWSSVFIDQGFFKEEMLSKEYLRWLYTAITRGTEKIYFVNFKDDFFINEQ